MFRKIGLFFLMVSFIIVYFHNVPKSLTTEDEIYIQKILKRCSIQPLAEVRTYQEEIEFLQKLQDSVIHYYPVGIGIPLNQPREPKDLYEHNQGLCFDRSRVFEKICISQGFKTRHIFLLLDERKQKSFTAFLRTDSVSTHAVSEVKTQKGWLVIGSNFPWIALTKQNAPLSIKEILAYNRTGSVPNDIYKTVSPISMWYDPNTRYIYGLYSRHGRFYAPFNIFPDFNFRELFQI